MSVCGQCGLTVTWSKTMSNGVARWHCHNPDGSDHWDLCSKARFERIKRKGTAFDTPTAAGYIHPEKVQFTRLNAPRKTGKRYVPDGCECGLPPWELCRADCPHAIRKVA